MEALEDKKHGRIKDLTGERYGKLIVLRRVENTSDGKAKWMCKCDCGNTKIARAASLRSGDTRSCGCLIAEGRKKAAEKLKGDKSHFYKHGLSDSRINSIYRQMKRRCLSKNNPAYKRYGGRGIKICDEWLDDFMNFYNWAVNNGYDESLTLDRKDVNKGYCPENCRWTSMSVQQNNRTNNVKITFNGEEHTLSEWSEITGLSKSTIYHRYEKGWETEKMLTTPPMKNAYSFRNNTSEILGR